MTDNVLLDVFSVQAYYNSTGSEFVISVLLKIMLLFSEQPWFFTYYKLQCHCKKIILDCFPFPLWTAAVLTIQPDRTQFFRYESFNLTCGAPGNFTSWRVKRNTSTGSFVPCQNNWGRPNGSSCINPKVFSLDSGLYWCESELECSNVLNISVDSE